MSTQVKIPVEWKKVKFGDICRINMGQSPSSSAYNKIGNGLPLIQGNNDMKNGLTISRVWTSECSKIAEKNSIILTVRAPVGAIGISHDRLCIGRGVCAISSESQNFIFYFLRYFEPKWGNLEQGSTFSAVNSSDIRNLVLVLPPLSEQEKIVEVLETWDSHLQKLSESIKLKKKVKKGLMQKLLSGKVRLKGFNETWEIVKLGEISQMMSGGTPSTKTQQFWNGDIPWVSSSDLITNNTRFINIHRYITPEAVKNSATKVIPPQSILVVSRVGVGKIAVNPVPICTSQDFQSIINSTGCFNAQFLANLLTIEIQQFLEVNQGSFIKGFLKNDLENLTIKLPPLSEQTAIANVLTDAELEIEGLEKKKSLIEQQKKFLLNNMITGRLRLPEFTKVSN